MGFLDQFIVSQAIIVVVNGFVLTFFFAPVFFPRANLTRLLILGSIPAFAMSFVYSKMAPWNARERRWLCLVNKNPWAYVRKRPIRLHVVHHVDHGDFPAPGQAPNVATPGVGMNFVWIISADPKERNLSVELHPDYKDMAMGPTHLTTK